MLPWASPWSRFGGAPSPRGSRPGVWFLVKGPLLRPFWSLFDGISGLLNGTSGVLVSRPLFEAYILNYEV